MHTCRPGGRRHGYFVSSFVPKFLGLCDRFNSAAIQQDRTDVCAYTCMSERERVHPSAWEFISLCMCVCVCVLSIIIFIV